MTSKHEARMIKELQNAFEKTAGLEKHIAIFGSARLDESHPACQNAYALSKRLSEAGFNISNGGGPSVMAESSRGAKEGLNGLNISHSITLPFEEDVNEHIDVLVEHEYFAIRKFFLLQRSQASVYFTGGWGTLDEFAALACLLTTGKMRNGKKYPLVIFGKTFWKGLLDWLENTVLPEGTISEGDLDRLFITDSVDEAFEHIVNNV